MLSRHIGAMLRGEATTGQVFGAAIIGSMLGFIPGFSNGAGLMVLLIAALVILNVSLPFALLVFALAKLVALLALPVSFTLGRALVDGPLQPLFRWAVNAPVLALMGFEHYATTGGLLIGLLFGLVLGWLVASTIKRVRGLLAGVDSGSEKYRAAVSKPWVKVVGWALLGAKDLNWSQPPAKTKKPVRMLGLIVVVLVAGIAAAAQAALTSSFLTGAVRRGLENANGATVDLSEASLDLAGGKLTMRGLAMADPAALDRDMFRAELIEAQVDTSDLLRKRLALDHVLVRSAKNGALRSSPGSRVGGEPEPAPPATEGGGKTLDDYVASAEQWRERLEQVDRWLKQLSGPPEEAAKGEPVWTEQMQRDAEAEGLARVTAAHLIEGAPSFLVKQLTVEELLSEALPGEVLDVNGSNLSSQPALVAEPGRLRVASRSGKLLADVALGGQGASTGKGALKFQLEDWPMDSIASALSVGGKPPAQGGTFDVLLDGGWAGGHVGQLDLPLKLALHDTTLQLGGKGQHVKSFALDLGLKGSLENPAIFIDEKGLAKALKDAGAAELASRVDEAKKKAESEAVDKVEKEVQDKLGDLLGGKKKKKD